MDPTLEKLLENLGDFGAGAKQLVGNLFRFIKPTEQIARLMRDTAEASKDLYTTLGDFATDLEADFGDFLNQYELIRQAYGDLQGLEANRASAANAALGRYETIMGTMYQQEVQVGNSRMKTEEFLQQALGTKENLLLLNFEEGEANRAVEDSIKHVNEAYARQVLELDELTVAKIPMYTKGLGMSTQEIGKMMEIQQLRTGKMGTDLIDQISIFSRDVSREIGVPMKSISADTVKIMSNIKSFGDVSAEEAVRIVGNLNQIGLKYDDLASTQQKFNKFSSAAENVGKIAQITGVQLDAQRISYLTATGQVDKALKYMRTQFKQQGFRKEDFRSMVLPLRNALADALPGGQEGVMNLLDDSRKLSDLQATTAKTRKTLAADDQAGIKSVTENLNKLDGAFLTNQQKAEIFRKKSLYPMAKSAWATAKSMRALNGAVLSANVPGMEQARQKYVGLMSAVRGVVNDPKTLEIIGKTFGLDFSGSRKGASVSGGGPASLIPTTISPTDAMRQLLNPNLSARAQQLFGASSKPSGAMGGIMGKFSGFAEMAVDELLVRGGGIDRADLDAMKKRVKLGIKKDVDESDVKIKSTGFTSYLVTAQEYITQARADLSESLTVTSKINEATKAKADEMETTLNLKTGKAYEDFAKALTALTDYNESELAAGKTFEILVPEPGGKKARVFTFDSAGRNKIPTYRTSSMRDI